jgi:hypothetical protein
MEVLEEPWPLAVAQVGSHPRGGPGLRPDPENRLFLEGAKVGGRELHLRCKPPGNGAGRKGLGLDALWVAVEARLEVQRPDNAALG